MEEAAGDLDSGLTVRGACEGQRVFGRYQLHRVLGLGGMGVVWLANDGELNRAVALKFVPELLTHDEEAIMDLKRETSRCLELTHPNIVRVYDFERDGKSVAIAMEYVAGGSLSDLKVRQSGRCFEVAQLRTIVAQLLGALDYAHTKGKVVHRDLKPSNLMMTGEGELKIADFGIARTVSDSLTRVSRQPTAGTLSYMSPEQALGSVPAVSDDIYAFGATLYDLLTGKPPFYTGNIMHQLECVRPQSMAERRLSLGTGLEPIPAIWEEVVAACLEKNASARPESAKALLAWLRNEVVFEQSAHRGVEHTGQAPNANSNSEHRQGVAPVLPANASYSVSLLSAAVVAVLLVIAAWVYSTHLAAQRAKVTVLASETVAKEAGDAKPISLDEEQRNAKERQIPVVVPEPIAQTGRLIVNTIPSGARVYLDNNDRGLSPIALDDVPIGSRRLKIVGDGYEPTELLVEIVGGGTADPGPVHLVRKSSPAPQPVYVEQPAPARAPVSAPPIPSSPPAETRPAQASRFERVRNILRTSLLAREDGTVDQEVACFTSPVDYYDEGRLTTSALRRVLQTNRRAWPSFDVSGLSEISVRATDDPDIFEASYSFDFTARNTNNGKVASGTAHDNAWIRWTGGEALIYQIRQKVTNRRKNF